MRELRHPPDRRRNYLDTGCECLQHTHWSALDAGRDEDVIEGTVEFRQLLLGHKLRRPRPTLAGKDPVDVGNVLYRGDEVLALAAGVIRAPDNADAQPWREAFEIDAGRNRLYPSRLSDEKFRSRGRHGHTDIHCLGRAEKLPRCVGLILQMREQADLIG